MARKQDSRGWFMTDADIARERGKLLAGFLLGALVVGYVLLYGL